MLEDKSFQNNPEWHGEDGAPLQGTESIPLDCHGASVMGKGRRVNQDDYLLTSLDVPSDSAHGPAFLFAVADGIGGGPAGDRASSMAIQTLHDFVRRTAQEPGLLQTIDPGELLRKGVLRCHDEILADVDAHPELFGMGTTLTAALVLWPKAWIVNAGDSRCYLLRDSRLDRLTFDHTLVQKLTDEGILTPETARKSRWRHALWNHLGKNSSPLDPQLATAGLKLGDGLLLTTDGITDPLFDADLEALLREPGSAKSLSRNILQAADVKGARDDMSLVFARFARRLGSDPDPD